MTRKPIEVVLPTCPVEGCDKISAIDAMSFGGKVFCVGKKDAPHKRTQMTRRIFIEKRNQ